MVSVLKVYVSMREFKEGVGGSGDPYMQTVRGYDLAVKVLRENPELFKTWRADVSALCLW